MQPTADFNPSKLARSLLRRSRQGALATLMTESHDPYCSLVNIASHFDASPILLISRLALHTRNILADNRVSLMLDERAAGDPLEGARIMLAWRAEEAAGDQAEILRGRYLNAHPSAEVFVDFKDFSFFRIRPSGALNQRSMKPRMRSQISAIWASSSRNDDGSQTPRRETSVATGYEPAIANAGSACSGG